VAQIYYIQTDHLNTPKLITDSTGTTVWKWDQGEPFGNDVPNNNPSGLGAFDLPLRLPGQYYDKETALHYNAARDYDPSIGRYVEGDPIGLEAGINTYAYVAGNPLSHIDPSGLKLWLCIRSCCGGVANHAYLYDDTTKQCCGDPGNFRGRRSRDYITTCSDKNGGPGVDTCWLISSSDDDAQKALRCCDKSTKGTTWGTPWSGDCQNRADDCIRELGMAPPNTPQTRRFQACGSCFRK
jgi:RHS repeat-associated protein